MLLTSLVFFLVSFLIVWMPLNVGTYSGKTNSQRWILMNIRKQNTATRIFNMWREKLEPMPLPVPDVGCRMLDVGCRIFTTLLSDFQQHLQASANGRFVKFLFGTKAFNHLSNFRDLKKLTPVSFWLIKMSLWVPKKGKLWVSERIQCLRFLWGKQKYPTKSEKLQVPLE